ncbi:Aromatic-l-amino-acid decarboxylase [Plakobranchus ocellatus]|uniref:Aromatic-L-amino-acid decarboxylase n=1 Tax=Plakobranchus ocellatus TaxID=259542 RepID=A0AAV4BKK5_9GAST|nr:Aromatic-l-amino-acid decarboxylase [Plakobranchus ocellatus]
MDGAEFRTRGREMVDYMVDYIEGITSRPPLPRVSPGYIRDLIPDQAPRTGETWESVKADLERIIMPGASSPACTELEVCMMDWLGKMLQLPREFLFCEEGKGGGVIQGTASEATLVALLSARTAAMHKLRDDQPELTQGQILDKLVAYTSEEAHSSVERASLIGMVHMRLLKTDERGSLRGTTLETAIREDREKGLYPFFLCATVGTTSRCTFDNLTELGPICTRQGLWMHVDAAYAGSACICPEFRYLLDGVEHSMSFNFNPHKWLRINFDCSAMWVKDRYAVTEAFEVNPLYLKHDHQGQAIPDYRHWHIPLGRRFRSLKVWFVLRMFGVSGLQQQIRKDVSLAKMFERLVQADDRFEIFGEVVLGLVCFRIKGENARNERLYKMINDDRRIHLTPSKVKDIYFLRFAICASSTQMADVTYAWSVIKELAHKMAASEKRQ